MKLAHHTTPHALKHIVKDKRLLPVYNYIWFTTCLDGEITAGMLMPEEHRGRVIIETFGKELYLVDDIRGEFPHLNFPLLNQITDTSKWYVSFEPINSEDFYSVSIMKDGEWIDESSKCEEETKTSYS